MHLPEFDAYPNALSPAGLGHWTHENSVRVNWICLISLEKVNAHLLTSNRSMSADASLSQQLYTLLIFVRPTRVVA